MILAQNQKGDALTEVVAKSWLKEVGECPGGLASYSNASQRVIWLLRA